MLWEDDDKQKDEFVVPDDVVDLSFRIKCRQIPTMHALELAEALYKVLPWIAEDPEIGIHQIHGAATGNGWERPPDGELMHLSNRAKMHLRVPREKIEDTKQIETCCTITTHHVHKCSECGVELFEIDNNTLEQYA